MKFIRIKSCCELLNVNCDQGRKCPVRTSHPYTIETVSDRTDTVVVVVMWLALTAVMASLAMAAGYFLYPF